MILALVQLLLMFTGGAHSTSSFNSGDSLSDTVYIHTADKNTYSELVDIDLHLGKAIQQISFAVQACNDVHVTLQASGTVLNSSSYEIVIGGWSNTMSVLRHGWGGKAVATYNRRGMLSCDERREFWITWKDSKVSVGTGLIPKRSTIFMQADKAPEVVRRIAVKTGWGSTGIWFIYKPSDHNCTAPISIEHAKIVQLKSAAVMYSCVDGFRAVRGTYLMRCNLVEGSYGWKGTPLKCAPFCSKDIHTEDSYTYQPVNIDLSTENSDRHIAFTVQACSDAFITLQTSATVVERNVYEILIGGWGNTKSVIRKTVNSQHLVENRTEKIVSCNERRPFWISWMDSKVTVGTGFTPSLSSQFLKAEGAPHSVRRVAVATGWGSAAIWSFVANCSTPPSIKKTQLLESSPRLVVYSCMDGYTRVRGEHALRCEMVNGSYVWRGSNLECAGVADRSTSIVIGLAVGLGVAATVTVVILVIVIFMFKSKSAYASSVAPFSGKVVSQLNRAARETSFSGSANYYEIPDQLVNRPSIPLPSVPAAVDDIDGKVDNGATGSCPNTMSGYISLGRDVKHIRVED